jgi:hypothetical protein
LARPDAGRQDKDRGRSTTPDTAKDEWHMFHRE